MKKHNKIKIIKRAERQTFLPEKTVKNSTLREMQREIAGKVKDWIGELRERKISEQSVARRLLTESNALANNF